MSPDGEKIVELLNELHEYLRVGQPKDVDVIALSNWLEAKAMAGIFEKISVERWQEALLGNARMHERALG